MATATTSHLPYEPQVISSIGAPLKQIYTKPLSVKEYRYLVLEGFEYRGLLKCRLQTSRLDKPQANLYTAISYACDESEPVWYGNYDHLSARTIIINETLVTVLNKVANILCMMQEKSRETIWIDFICINQNDDPEKSIQVAQMGDIYSLAKEVISVLGKPSVETDTALQSRFWRSKDQYHTNYATLFYGIDHLLAERIYWRRAWVLQEIALAKRTYLCCGSYMLDYALVKELLDMIRGQRLSNFDLKNVSTHGRHLVSMLGQRLYRSGLSRSEVRPSRVPDTRSVLRVVKKRTLEVLHARPFAIGTEKDIRGRPFLEVLQRSRQFNQCTDPRDLIYSRLALASDSSQLVSSPDYTISTEEVFKRFATNCISPTGCLDVITYATHSRKALPSWVPDWTTQFHDWEPDRDRSDNRNAMAAITWDTDHPPRVSSDESNELETTGRILARVLSGEQSTTKRGVDKVYQFLLEFSTDDEYDEEENPRPGDLICILQGCSLFVYLCPVSDHYIIVGRNDRWQKKIFGEFLLPQLWIYRTKNHAGEDDWKWKFWDPEGVEKLEQRLFRIR